MVRYGRRRCPIEWRNIPADQQRNGQRDKAYTRLQGLKTTTVFIPLLKYLPVKLRSG